MDGPLELVVDTKHPHYNLKSEIQNKTTGSREGIETLSFIVSDILLRLQKKLKMEKGKKAQ